MKLNCTRLLLKILLAASALGLAQAANAACTQQNIAEQQSFLRLNLGDDICATKMGFSRDTFYRYQAAMADAGLDALLDSNRVKPNFRNRIKESIESAVVAFAVEQPAFGQVRVTNELRNRSVFVSASGVRCVWLRHDLESFKKRLNALEKHVAATGEVLT